MADGDTTDGLTPAQSEAFEVLSERFGAQRLERLPSAAALSLCDAAGTVGFKVEFPADYTGKSRELWIILPGGLPLDPPMVHIQPVAYRQWPHIESNGKFCLWRDGESPVGHSAAEQMRQTLVRVSDVVALIYPEFNAPAAQAEFEREWTSYWMPGTGRGRTSSAPVLLIDTPVSTGLVESTRLVGSSGTHYVLAGGSADLRARWSAALGAATNSTTQAATLSVQLSKAPLGAPNDLQALQALLSESAPAGALDLLTTLIQRQQAFSVVVRTGSGQELYAAVDVTPVPERRPSSGYQNSRSRQYRIDHRRIGSWRICAASAERADASWLRGRGFDSEALQLSSKHVVVIGCGSLGGLVIRALAAGGVGRLSLVDPDSLSTANLGRHVLSARYLGCSKAKALAQEINFQNPNTRVEAFSVDVAKYSMPTGSDLPDLVISTTANWPADHRLIALHASGTVQNLQLTWTERHAIAGHALLTSRRENDLSALFDDDGYFLRAATDWKEKTYALPGCQGSHQPGTFNRIQRIASLAVEQAIGFLVGRVMNEHRAWLGDSATLEALGGTWTSNWPAVRDVVERILVQALPTRTNG